ncbi:MAG: O-methyltransferase [Dongiaceae bacterium]
MTHGILQPHYRTAACAEILEKIGRASRRSMPRLIANLVLNYKIMRKPFEIAFKTSDLQDVPMAISPDEGEFLYQITRAKRAALVVEFGTSFGVSAIYAASALRDQGFGHFIGTEIETSKVAQARRNLAAAGLSEFAEVRAGDARETLANIAEPIDILFLDGWKNLYLPILILLLPKLPPGSVVLADNMKLFERELTPFRKFMEDPAGGGFLTATLPIGDGLEFAVRLDR